MTTQTVESVDYSQRVHTSATEMPAELEPHEVSIYRRGYSRSCQSYIRKHGAPSVSGPVPESGPARAALGAELSRMAREHEAARHPAAHRAGIAAVNKRRRALGLEPIPTGAKRATRTKSAPKLCVVPDVPSAPETAPAELEEQTRTETAPESAPAPVAKTYRTKRDARRDLAEEMRARGENPADPAAWTAAKLSAGIR